MCQVSLDVVDRSITSRSSALPDSCAVDMWISRLPLSFVNETNTTIAETQTRVVHNITSQNKRINRSSIIHHPLVALTVYCRVPTLLSPISAYSISISTHPHEFPNCQSLECLVLLCHFFLWKQHAESDDSYTRPSIMPHQRFYPMQQPLDPCGGKPALGLPIG